METNSEELRLGIVALMLFALWTVLFLERLYRVTPRLNRPVVLRNRAIAKRSLRGRSVGRKRRCLT
jgi:hypothetical protein